MSNPNESSNISVTHWFRKLADGDELAAEVLWNHFFPSLVRLAQQRFRRTSQTLENADDAATSAIRILFRGAQQGRYRHIQHRDELWKILVVATRRKIIDRYRADQTRKRGGGVATQPLTTELVAHTPTAETLLILNEDLQELLDVLRDDTLRQIALLRLEGFQNSEIAEQLSVSERTIERKLRLIRTDWEHKLEDLHVD